MAINRQADLQRFIEIVEHDVPRGKIDGPLRRIPLSSRRNQGWKTTRLRDGTPMRSYNSLPGSGRDSVFRPRLVDRTTGPEQHVGMHGRDTRGCSQERPDGRRLQTTSGSFTVSTCQEWDPC